MNPTFNELWSTPDPFVVPTRGSVVIFVFRCTYAFRPHSVTNQIEQLIDLLPHFLTELKMFKWFTRSSVY